MKTFTTQQNARIPSYALSYLVNGDASGLSANDLHIINRWYDIWLKDALNVNGSLVVSPTGEREFFTKYPEFGLSCDCTECDILILVE